MRTVLIAAVVSLVTSILCTPLVVAYFRRRGFGQEIRVDGPQTHLVKRGTPTMGGVAIVGSTVFGYVVAHAVKAVDGSGAGPSASGLLLLFLMVGLGVVGFLDDFIKIRKQRSLGLRARAKFGGQLLVAVVFAVLAMRFRNGLGLTPASTHLSYVRDISELGLGSVGFVVVAYLIISATSNAVNLTDGLDGLAAGASAMVFGAYTLITFLQSRNTCGTNPAAGCYNVRDPLDIAIVAAAAMAACFGFLWWNASPAQIFMGDTGSLALGGLMAGMAILSRTELLLVVLGGLFAAITVSDVIQIGWFKLTKDEPAPGGGCSGWRRCTTTSSSAGGRRSRSSSGSGSSPGWRSPSGWGCSTPTSSAMADPLHGGRVLVCGVGLAGASAARALLGPGARVALTALGESPAVAGLVAGGARWLGGLAELPDVDLVVASPGLRPSHPLLAAAAERGVPVWGEVELAWRLDRDRRGDRAVAGDHRHERQDHHRAHARGDAAGRPGCGRWRSATSACR